jgi:molybdopterin biosynthesis enzyme
MESSMESPRRRFMGQPSHALLAQLRHKEMPYYSKQKVFIMQTGRETKPSLPGRAESTVKGCPRTKTTSPP